MLVVSKEEIIERNRVLIHVLQERLAIDANDLISSLNVKMQFRLFYTAILVGISSLLFYRKNSIREIGIEVVLFFLVATMYLLEIHFDDLIKRQKDVHAIKTLSIDSLVNLSPTDSTWYNLNKWDEKDSATVAFHWYKASDKCETHKRKFVASLSPDREQVVYYWFPLSVVSIYSLWRIKKKSKKTFMFL